MSAVTPTEEVLTRLDVLRKKLDDEGLYVRANTISLAIDEIKEARSPLAKAGDKADIYKLANIAQALWSSAEDEVERLGREVAARDHLIATVITNLRNGIDAEKVVAWFEAEGEPSLNLEASL